MRAFAEFNDYEVAGEYEDAGKSGKSIEGRDEFNRMMEDIKTGKDDVSFVLVFKLSRFGRNAADVLSTLQTMQDFGVNLICVEDGIDSSKDAGKLMISVLSAVASIPGLSVPDGSHQSTDWDGQSLSRYGQDGLTSASFPRLSGLVPLLESEPLLET